MRLILMGILACALAAAPALGQQTPLVVRLGVDLVQIDAVVTDKKGRAVTDLVAADFEILQDGRPQTVTQAAFMGVLAGAGGPGSPTLAELVDDRADEATAPADPSEAIVFVVDDLALSVSSVSATRNALLSFADGMDDASQVFLLRTAARLLEMRPVMGPAELRATARALVPRLEVRGEDLLQNQTRTRYSPFDFRAQSTSHYLNSLLARRSLLSLHDITDALRSWKGRKTLVFFSEGFPIWDSNREVLGPFEQVYGLGDDVLDAVDRLTDLANRASVVIHTVDPRGLLTAGISASDATMMSHQAIVDTLQTRRQALHISQGSLSRIADLTGGLSVLNTNDLGAGVARILADSRGYYLVGYEPPRETFAGERPRFHQLKVRVKRPGLKVRSRKGFFGLSDAAVAALAPPQTF
ncbi:MAG TPA: VWA domain-containing protein [Vicinamibacteria bacterium]